MNQRGLRNRRLVGVAVRSVALVSATMVVLSGWAFVAGPGAPAVAAPTVDGASIVNSNNNTTGGVPLTTGGSSTTFSVKLPSGATCPGDTASGNYRWQTYMVPSSVDPTSLQFNASGPTPAGTGANFRQPLYATPAFSPVVDQATAAATTPGGPGQIINIPDMSFGFLGPGDLGAGTYNVGIACTLGPASATQVTSLWNLQFVVTSDSSDSPAKIKWTAQATQSSSTTTSSTSASSTSTTSSTVAGSTDSSTTTTSTTLSGGSTVSTTSTTTVGAGNGDPDTSGGSSASGTLARTGSSPTRLLVWTFLFLVFGRMALLLGRTPESADQ